MAQTRTNIMLLGSFGKLGGYVVRRWGNKAVISLPPSTKHRKWSKLQKANRLTFKEAMAYARRVLSDPEVWNYYKKKRRGKQTVWNCAVADFMLKPTIDVIDVSEYEGAKGDEIVVVANDKYAVGSVIVSIVNAQGLEIESGPAIHDWTPGWRYTAKMKNRTWKGCRVNVEVHDVPGNVVSGFRMIEQT